MYYKKEYKNTSNNKKMFAIMIERNEGEYVEYRSKNWPKSGYIFNPEKTTCIDKDNNNIGNLITYDSEQGIAHMKSVQSAFCTLYFDKE